MTLRALLDRLGRPGARAGRRPARADQRRAGPDARRGAARRGSAAPPGGRGRAALRPGGGRTAGGAAAAGVAAGPGPARSTLADLAGLDLVTAPPATAPGWHDHLLAVCRRHGFAPGRIRHARNPEFLFGLVLAGGGGGHRAGGAGPTRAADRLAADRRRAAGEADLGGLAGPVARTRPRRCSGSSPPRCWPSPSRRAAPAATRAGRPALAGALRGRPGRKVALLISPSSPERSHIAVHEYKDPLAHRNPFVDHPEWATAIWG